MSSFAFCLQHRWCWFFLFLLLRNHFQPKAKSCDSPERCSAILACSSVPPNSNQDQTHWRGTNNFFFYFLPFRYMKKLSYNLSWSSLKCFWSQKWTVFILEKDGRRFWVLKKHLPPSLAVQSSLFSLSAELLGTLDGIPTNGSSVPPLPLHNFRSIDAKRCLQVFG